MEAADDNPLFDPVPLTAEQSYAWAAHVMISASRDPNPMSVDAKANLGLAFTNLGDSLAHVHGIVE